MNCPKCGEKISSYNDYAKAYYEKNKEKLNAARNNNKKRKIALKKETSGVTRRRKEA